MTLNYGSGPASYECIAADVISEEISYSIPYSVTAGPQGTLYFSSLTFNAVFSYNPASQVQSNYAGTGTSGYSGDGGFATAAKIFHPANLGTDLSNNVFFADSANNVIRRVDAVTNKISTAAGTGTAGTLVSGSPATSAPLNNPFGVFLDTVGDMYIALKGNAQIVYVDASGILHIIAGTGSQGSSGMGGQATSAAITEPLQLTVDKTGIPYWVEQDTNLARKAAVNGIISIFMGTGSTSYNGEYLPATSANLNLPSGIAIDPFDGRVYVSNSNNNRVQQVTSYGNIVSTVAGNGTSANTGNGGPAILATVKGPLGMGIDTTGALYFATTGQIRVVN